MLIYVLFFILSKYVYIVESFKQKRSTGISLVSGSVLHRNKKKTSGTLPWIAECAACFLSRRMYL